MDRWVMSGATDFAQQVTEDLESLDAQRAGTLLASYVDLLSNWYVRRSRRRFGTATPPRWPLSTKRCTSSRC